MQIPQKNGNYQYGKQDLFAVVIALRYLISSEDFKAFKSNLTKLINNVLRQCPHLTHEQLLMEMGFPENWEKIMRYKKFVHSHFLFLGIESPLLNTECLFVFVKSYLQQSSHLSIRFVSTSDDIFSLSNPIFHLMQSHFFNKR